MVKGMKQMEKVTLGALLEVLSYKYIIDVLLHGVSIKNDRHWKDDWVVESITMNDNGTRMMIYCT
jgi:hypothetical protein